jgi:hypothetical protein
MKYNANIFEHDWILRLLTDMECERRADKPQGGVLDKYAVALTAFMQGQVVASERRVVKEICEHLFGTEPNEDGQRAIAAIHKHLGLK